MWQCPNRCHQEDEFQGFEVIVPVTRRIRCRFSGFDTPFDDHESEVADMEHEIRAHGLSRCGIHQMHKREEIEAPVCLECGEEAYYSQ